MSRRVERYEEAYRPVPKSWRQARNALLGLCVAAWLVMSLVIALAGWGSRSLLHQNFGLSLFVFGVVVGGGAYANGRWKLSRQAAKSLQARADLRGLELGETMEATFVVFDLTQARVRAVLEEPEVRSVLDADVVSKDLAASGDELFELAKRHVSLRRDEERLRRQSQTDAVESARATNAEERERIEQAANRIAEELQSLRTKVESIRTIARAGGDENRTRLEEATRELDASTLAIKELARLERPGARAPER